MNRKAQRVSFEIPERHLDQRLGLGPALDGRIHRSELAVNVERFEADDNARELLDGGIYLLGTHRRVAGRRIHVTPSLGPIVGYDAKEGAHLARPRPVHTAYRMPQGHLEQDRLERSDTHGV